MSTPSSFLPTPIHFIVNKFSIWHGGLLVKTLVDSGFGGACRPLNWMSEINLGIGRAPYQDGEVEIEVLYWYDQQGNRYLTAEERAESAEQTRRDSIPRLLAMGLSMEQVAEALSLTVEEVRQRS